jgi:hypothetical protein
MNNYINLRLKAHNHEKTFSSIKHNIRHIKTLSEKDDLSNDKNHNDKNFIVVDDRIFELNKNKDFIKSVYNELSLIYKKDRKKHNELYREANKDNESTKNRNIRNSKSTWVEGVFTFSEQFKTDLNNKYTFEDLVKVANECLKDVAKKMGSEIKYLIYHGDETTGHFHYALSNFDKKGMSLFNKIKNKDDLSQLQDIAAKHFQSLGMKRGIKKEVIGLNHQDQKLFYEREINLMKNENTKLNNQHKELLKVVFDLTNKKELVYSELNNLKELRKEISEDVELSKEEKKLIYDEITNKQKELRNYKNELITIDKEVKEFSKNAKSDINEVLNSSKKIVGFDVEILRKSIYKKFKQYSKFDLKLKEFELIKTKNNELNESNESLLNQNKSLKMVIKGMNEDIKKLKEDLGNRDYQIEHIDSANIAKIQEATRTLRNELNELKNTSKDEICAKDKVIEKQNKSINKRNQIIKKYIDKKQDSLIDLNYLKHENKRFEEFLTKKCLLEEFRSVEDSASNRLDTMIDNDFSLSSIVIDNNKKRKKK